MLSDRGKLIVERQSEDVGEGWEQMKASFRAGWLDLVLSSASCWISKPGDVISFLGVLVVYSLVRTGIINGWSNCS